MAFSTDIGIDLGLSLIHIFAGSPEISPGQINRGGGYY